MRDLIDLIESAQTFQPLCNDVGKPIVFYHGTTGDFGNADQKFTGENGRAMGSAIYFSGDPEYAADYARERLTPEKIKARDFERDFAPGANVRPVHLDIRNPLMAADLLSTVGSTKLADYAKENGYDGIIYHAGKPYYEVAVFDPRQVRGVFSEDIDESEKVGSSAVRAMMADAIHFARSVQVQMLLRYHDDHTVEITDLNAKHPGSGGGTKALNHICELADELGVSILILPSNERNKTFYQRFGFERSNISGGVLIRFAKLDRDED